MNIFDRVVKKGRIIKNKDVLRPTYMPDYLPHREKQINRIGDILSDALVGEITSNVLIYGKTGTGKTACAKYVGKELEIASKNDDYCVYVPHLNCQIIDTQYRIFSCLASYFNREIPTTGLPMDRVYLEFKKALESEEKSVIVVLDEIDRLVRRGDEALYNLSRINAELRKSRVSIIGISNDLRFIQLLDPRIRSSLGQEEIIFPPYDANQLRDILEQRAKLGFQPNVLDDDVIPLCAALAAKEHGDARKALDLLRVSGEIAERSEIDEVREEDVRVARDRIEFDRVRETVRTLPMQSKLVLYGIAALDKKTSGITTGDVYQVYKMLCGELGVEPLTQRRVADLISELDMLGVINATIVSKGRYGRTREISLSVPLENVMFILNEEPELREVEIKPIIQAKLQL